MRAVVYAAEYRGLNPVPDNGTVNTEAPMVAVCNLTVTTNYESLWSDACHQPSASVNLLQLD